MAQVDSHSNTSQELAAGTPFRANLARQPILDAELKTVGYELLFREGATNVARFDDGTRATSIVLTNALSEFGLDTIVGSLPAWVNFPAQYLLAELPIPIAPKGLVIEVLEDAKPNDELVQRLRQLTKQGYRIALDDFRYGPEYESLIESAQIIKVDVFGRTLDDIASEVREFRRYKVQLL